MIYLSFFGSNFIYDNITSESFNLKIGYLNSGGTQESTSGSNIKIISDKVRRKPKPYFYGVEIEPVLEFDMFVYSEVALDIYDLSAINKWLYGRQQYKWLQVQQENGMEGIWYNCFLTNPQDIYIGNLPYCKKFTVVCDAPWAWTDEFTYNYTITTPNQSIIFNNLSDCADDYLYPYVSFTISSTTTNFSIKNNSDNGREFKFTNISGNETITVNNELQIITSSTLNNRLNNFNLKWLRLVSGNNSLIVNGNCPSLIFKMRFPKKIGG
jgi:hypothetical protein